jgi:hypothetical protein
MALTTPGVYTDFPNASDVALPGESVEADPYGALAYLESTGQTVAPPLAQLTAAETAAGTVTAPAAPVTLPGLTDTFTIGGISIPYWTVGAVIGVWLLMRRK